jgi:hypothetical protein
VAQSTLKTIWSLVRSFVLVPETYVTREESGWVVFDLNGTSWHSSILRELRSAFDLTLHSTVQRWTTRRAFKAIAPTAIPTPPATRQPVGLVLK